MDLLCAMMQIASLTLLTVGYLIWFGGSSRKKTGHYSEPGWNFFIKKLYAKHAVRRWRGRRERAAAAAASELPGGEAVRWWERQTVRAAAPDGTVLLLELTQQRDGAAELEVQVSLPDGTRYVLPTDESSRIEVMDASQWSAGGLKFVMLEPLVRWRILYSGLLASHRDHSLTHVRLNLIWTAASRPVRYPEDWSDELAATAMATERWRDGGWHSVLDASGAGGGWEQWGSVQGTLRADDEPEVVVRARGVRERWWAPAPAHAHHVTTPADGQRETLVGQAAEQEAPLRLHRAVSLLATAYDGTAVYLRVHSHTDPGAPTQAVSGSIHYSNAWVESIAATDLRLRDFCEHRDRLPSTYTITVAASKPVEMVLQLDGGAANGRRRAAAALHAVTLPARLTLDGERACGILELGYAFTDEEARVCAPAAPSAAARLRWTPPESLAAAERDSSCAHFSRAAAACPQLVGAKGASLALLASLHNEEYAVPPGFCLSTRALERHVARHPALRDAVQDIVHVNRDYDEAVLKERCARAVQLFTDTPLEGEVRSELVAHLAELRREVEKLNLVDHITFAVRSSAIGEDSEELSAAGQNDTVLGCADELQVVAGVQRCWASLYSFHSTQYRRLHGQPTDSGMGVVVQAVVPARAAGVLFSRHPNTGHPARILLTANYGLGESVVSGQVEPDTVLLERQADGGARVLSVQLGSKSHRVTLGAGGTRTVALTAVERGDACVTVAECQRLGRLAVRQEALWGAPRDLEWAIYKDKIYLVQARPITSLERWTEYELLHEMDTAIMSDQDAYTFANTGEVLPGALTPLTVSTVGYELMSASHLLAAGEPLEPYSGHLPFFISHYHYGINIYNTMLRRVGKKIDLGVRVLEMAVYGHEVADERMHSVAARRNPPSLLDSLFTVRLLLKTLFGTKAEVESTRREVSQLVVDKLRPETPHEMLHALEDSMSSLFRCFLHHNVTTSGSVFSQVVAMSVLLEGAEKFSLEHLADIGLMLSSCSDVVSADVPAALAAIARALHASPQRDQFCTLLPADCQDWMRDNCPEAYAMLTRFLEEHAHRNIKEFDLATKTWGIDPTSLLQSIQAAVKTKAADADEAQVKLVRSNREIAASVVSPKRTITRWLLQAILPLCQRTVSHREETKALSILAVHKVRLACLYLASLMQRDWLLPDQDLVFFFTLRELRAYLDTRDPALIKKASQRRQYFPAWNALKFAEVNEGPPRPLPTRDPRLARAGGAGGARLRGTPVCSGDVIGRACVVTDLAEIGQLQRGDILITHSTDIGWSPYFPLLGGVVTELGGLISHGAVIAREYGLPCMVGAGGATEFCRTGDLVLLAGATGVLERLDAATPTPQPHDDAPDFPAPH